MKLMKKIKSKISKIVNKITKRDKWKLYLYYNGQCIDKKYVDETFEPLHNFYIVKIKGRANLIGTNKKTQLILRFYKYKLTNQDKKEVHIETIIYEGSDLQA